MTSKRSELEALAAKVGVYYYDGRVSLGAPLYAFTPDELHEFARRLQPARVQEGMSLLVDALEGAMIESLHGEGFDLWAKNRGKFRNRLPENVGAIVVKMRALLAAAPAAEGGTADAWRKAFIEERARRYRDEGMKIEQARIAAGTDAQLMTTHPAPESPEAPKECPGCGADQHDGACEPQPFEPEAGRGVDFEALAQFLYEAWRAEFRGTDLLTYPWETVASWTKDAWRGIARRLAASPVAADGVEALAAIYRDLIKILADIANTPQTDKHCADDALPRPHVMDCVVRARSSLDKMSSQLQAIRLACAQQPSAPAAVLTDEEADRIVAAVEREAAKGGAKEGAPRDFVRLVAKALRAPAAGEGVEG